jgi:ligand-binding sensor domain-containing protein/DNA-binding CsgD family transcriptional regulator
MRIIPAILLLLISFGFSFATNEGMPIIKNFKAETYEGGSRIYSIVCTKEGVLYAGDKSGILKFDGEKWDKIECGFSVTSMTVNSKGEIYVAGNKGIGKLVPDSAQANSYKSLNDVISTQKSIRKFQSSKVFNIKDRIVYVLNNEIVINTPENIRIIEFPHRFSYYQKLDSSLYFYSPDDGVYRLNGNKLVLIREDPKIRNKNVVGFFHLNNQLHILVDQQGIFNLEKTPLSSEQNLMPELVDNKAQGMDQIDDSTYALKTYYKGVVLFNSKGQIINQYNYKEGLINNTVFSVFRDYWDNLWIGTASGISVIRMNFPFSKYNNHRNIGTGYASVLYKDKLYFATSQGLYASENDSEGNLEFFKLFDGHVWGLHVIGDLLYFGSASGIYSWNTEETNQISPYPGGWYIESIPGHKDYFLTGSPSGLILMRSGDDNVLEHVRVIKGIDANIENIEVDEANNFWAEFEKGILKFNLNEDLTEVENLRSFDRIEANNKLKKLIKFNNQELYFVADSGIYSYHNKDERFIKDTIFNSLYEQKIFPSNIVVDAFNRMWIFSEGKLFCYSFANDEIKKHHLGYIEYANNKYPTDYENVYSVDSNFVIIGQEQGFLGYNLTYEYYGTYSASWIRKVVIRSRDGTEEEVTVEEEIKGGGQYGELDKPLKNGNSIKFYYSAGASQYNSVKYSTFLYGFDEEWPEWNNETIKEYTNLPPGEYKFIVRSINRSNELSIPAVYHFEVLPPWYLTWKAKIVYGFLFVIIIVLIERGIQHRTKKLQRKLKKEQEDILYRKEQAQIQENLKKKQEIFKLKNEKLRIDNLYKSKELANSTMGIIKKNQFLTDLKSHLEKIRGYAEQNKYVTEDIQHVIRKIDRDIDNEENWKVFEDYFDRVHEKFLNRLKAKYPILTSKDLRLCAYLRMNLSTKEIAPMMNISVRGVEISRYRLRKKLELGRNDNLNDFLLKF